MPAAGAKQPLSAVLKPVGCNAWGMKTEDTRKLMGLKRKLIMKQKKDKNINFWRNYLILVGYSLIVMGAYVALLNNTPLFALFGNLIDPVFWPDNRIIEGTQHFKGFIYSFSGVYVLLWGINFLFISKYALVQGNKWAWNCLAISIIIWFVIMIPFSIYYKVYYNAISDITFLILILIPMIKIRRYIY